MSSASIAETHRFGRVRKSGYDPVEVDAVIGRLVDELRRTDKRITRLTEKLDTADASADAIRRTFVAAESTRDEIIEEARTKAGTITKAARSEAQAVADIAEKLESEIAASRERIIVGLYTDADRLRSDIERKAAERSTSAEWDVLEATHAANRTIAEAEARASEAEHAAHMRANDLRERITSMEQAAATLERAAITLAESVQHDTRIVDLAAIEHLDRFGVETIVPSRIDDLAAAPTNEPLRSVSKPADSSPRGNDVPQTRYQRVTGVRLSERIKIARMSG